MNQDQLKLPSGRFDAKMNSFEQAQRIANKNGIQNFQPFINFPQSTITLNQTIDKAHSRIKP